MKGRILSYEAPFGIGYLVADVTVDDSQQVPLASVAAAEADEPAPLRVRERRSLFRRDR